MRKYHNQSLARMANLPLMIDSPFILYYKHEDQQVLFIGEDRENELARGNLNGRVVLHERPSSFSEFPSL